MPAIPDILTTCRYLMPCDKTFYFLVVIEFGLGYSINILQNLKWDRFQGSFLNTMHAMIMWLRRSTYFNLEDDDTRHETTIAHSDSFCQLSKRAS